MSTYIQVVGVRHQTRGTAAAVAVKRYKEITFNDIAQVPTLSDIAKADSESAPLSSFMSSTISPICVVHAQLPRTKYFGNLTLSLDIDAAFQLSGLL